MESAASTAPRFHVLLIGIDAYPDKPLGGCVNDIDAIERLLLGPRVQIPPANIVRLASPLADARHETRLPSQPATLANIRAAISALASPDVRPADRVLIYFSGHGGRTPVVNSAGRVFHREALIPVDVIEDPARPRLWFDFELNAALRKIARRTRAIALVMDACHAAGATRTWGVPDTPRYLDLADLLRSAGPLADPADGAEDALPFDDVDRDDLGRGVDDCQTVAACLGHEVAYEAIPDGGRKHGRLTRALVGALEASEATDLTAVTWAQIWEEIRASVTGAQPRQHPWISGPLGRAVLAGPAIDGDAGIPAVHAGAEVKLLAGSLADVTEGARLAIYGGLPAKLPALGSLDERRARLGVVEVTRATLSEAYGTWDRSLDELPGDARARVIAPGTAPRLRCAIPPEPARVRQSIAASHLLAVVDRSAPADVYFEPHAGRWYLTDDVCGLPGESRVLFSLAEAELDRARALLEHYLLYARPLRIAQRAHDLPGALAVRVLRAPELRAPPSRAQHDDLDEMPTGATDVYPLAAGSRVCFRVDNRSEHDLRVTLVNSAASGRVQMLGDQICDRRSSVMFWENNVLGQPFVMVPPARRFEGPVCVDRLVAIGRTAFDRDLGFLQVETTFAEAVEVTRDAGELRSASSATALERWTAAQATVLTRVGPG